MLLPHSDAATAAGPPTLAHHLGRCLAPSLRPQLGAMEYEINLENLIHMKRVFEVR